MALLIFTSLLPQASFNLAAESTIDTAWWAQYSKGASDEWGLCANQGSQCGSVLERHYATWINPALIDELYGAGANTLRIPTTYAAWVKVQGSRVYSGKQVPFLRNIATYATMKYGMHVIINVHSLPGGVNGMPFDEAEGHFGCYNQTALNYSLETPESYTIAPINEAGNKDLSCFGTPLASSDIGAAWVLQYILAVISSGSFRGEAYCITYICSDAEESPGDGKFPVFIGEWSVQAEFDSTLAGREQALNTGLSYWTAKFHGNATVDGESTQADCWNYLAFAEQGMINRQCRRERMLLVSE
ncbi:glycoside hydrolase superfamily [Aspergillus falconensis]